ncbi:MAG: hypothetical protein K8L97_31125 [Anaerolineae bacterium]|nr:hypothetical protein [Anaerolineae bacterium]
MMRKQEIESNLSLSANEFAQIDITPYADYPEVLFLHVIVRRGRYWRTALLQLEGGKVKYSSVNPQKFTLEKEAREACEQEHNRIQQLFRLVLPNFDIRPMWFV